MKLSLVATSFVTLAGCEMSALQSVEIGNCSSSIGDIPLARRQTFATAMGTPIGNVPTSICERVASGVASGRLTRDDINAVYKGALTANTL